MGKIIGFAGRLGSGKSELAKICEEKGYRRIAFAMPLKQLVADVIKVDISDINELKNVEKDYSLTKLEFMYIATETGIPYQFVLEEMEGVKFTTVRQLLQFIGTNLIRKHNPNWHVNRLRNVITGLDADYVIDDVRFPNELELIKEFGGDAWFIIRPMVENISNHESETSLDWRDFGTKIIINDNGLERFKFRWESFLSHYEQSIAARDKYMKSDCLIHLYSEVEEPLSMFELLEIPMCLFKFKDIEFDCEKIEKVTMDGKKIVTIQYNDGTSIILDNPLNIEDLKRCL